MLYLGIMALVIALFCAAAAGWDFNNYANARQSLTWPLFWLAVAICNAATAAVTIVGTFSGGGS